MATNPYFTQYHTQRFSFIGSPQQRDGYATKDQRFYNMYPEMIKSPISDGKKYYLKKRPGTAAWLTLPAGTGRGVFFWPSNAITYTCIGNQVYANNTPLITLTTNSGQVGFCEFRSDTQDLLIFVDGVHGWIISTGDVVTQITDANFPSPHVPTPVFIDGYIFLAKSLSQQICNSTLNNPFAWPSDGFIDAEMFPDIIVGLNKVQNYLAVVGQQSIEWLYDNGNATGSPLQRNAPAVSQFGCPAPMTINQTEKELILVGDTGNGGRTVWVIDGFQPSEIANEPVREALDAEGNGISSATAFSIQCAGHKWYVLNLYVNSRTFVFDFEEKMWHEWGTGGNAPNVLEWMAGTNTFNGVPILLSKNSGAVGQMSPNYYTDFGGPIFCMVVTVKIDFDTDKRKRFYRLSLVGDSPNGDNTVPMTVYWSDDDYNTWTNGVTMAVNATYPTITQLGYSRRRAFKFTFQQPYALRLESFELDIIQEVRR